MCELARHAVTKPALPHWSWARILLLAIAGGTLWYWVLDALGV